MSPTIRKVLIANRGEIAVRVVEACRRLGVASVAVYSDADATAKHVRVADEAVRIGGPAARESYLDVPALISAARACGADAVHPGYGFLAENADFAASVEQAGLIFVGPPAGAIASMGEKVAARRIAREAGVPQVPGSASAVRSAEEILQFGTEHGYPVAVKAAYGGGGRGMRLVHSPAEADEALASAQREALAAFGHDDVYLERYLAHARHIEVQVFADSLGHCVWLGDRDCSVQRRHQKVIEEAPAPGLDDETRQAMGEASVRLARAVGYVGAGTVEFLYQDGAFYFLEMNTRIQVEHPVTEQVLNIDLVAEQIRVAAGLPLSFAASGPPGSGHAIEIRINAEDCADGAFLPAPGVVSRLDVPSGPGLRFDGGYETGDEIPPYYDSLVGKLIAWAPTRTEAVARLIEAARACEVAGVPTTIPAAVRILQHDDFQSGSIHTRWLEEHVAAGLLDQLDEESSTRSLVWVGERQYEIPYFGSATAFAGPTAGATSAPTVARSAATGRRGRTSTGTGAVVSPMQGTVLKALAQEGDRVNRGDLLFVIEAMKMENPVKAAIDGVVTEVRVSVGDVVTSGAALATVTPE